jgi:hypothetical protein
VLEILCVGCYKGPLPLARNVALLAFGIVDGLLRSTRSGHNQGAGSKQLGGSDGMHLGVRRGSSRALFGELCSKPKTGIRVDECRTSAGRVQDESTCPEPSFVNGPL